jgi:Uma2 family endonuclease
MHMPALKRYWTVDDLDDLPDDGRRYEVIDGDLFVTPAPSFNHQAAVGALYRRIAEYLERERIGYVFVSPADVTFSPKRSVQPDVFVVPLVDGRRPRAFDQVKRLLLAVEVLSASTARADRVVKRAMFRDEGVAEFWIVDLDARTFERSTPGDSRVEVFDAEIDWRPDGASVSLVIDLPLYFIEVLDT